MQLKEESILQGGKYRIIRVLGQGGFGITYLAENTFLERKIAIKEFFPKDFCGRDDTSHLTLGTQNNAETVEKLKARFLKEAKNIAKLSHPGIIKIHDVFEENNTAYYVMDYIEGQSLADMVKTNGPLDEMAAINYIEKVGDSLEYIHSHQMTHFDVKPANIMVRASDNEPKLIDFGLSKQYDSHGDATSTIMQGISHGFSPIELYNAGSVAIFSPQTDVYSLGATLYYLLTGNIPPSASQVLEDGITLPDNISHGVISAIKRAMSANRTKRYKSVNNFCRALLKSADNEENITIVGNVTPNNNVDSVNEQTLLVGTELSDISEGTYNRREDQKTNNTVYSEEEYEVEPSKWKRFITKITGTQTLVNTYSLSSTRKIIYALTLLIAFALSFGLGWIFWFILLRRIINSIKYLFFPNNLSEWDYAYEYSKGKALTVLISIIILNILLLVIPITCTNKQHKDSARQTVQLIKDAGSIYFGDIRVDSIYSRNDDVIFKCVSQDSTIFDNKTLNQKINELKIRSTFLYYITTIPQFKDLIYMDNNIFQVANLDGSVNDIIIPGKETIEFNRKNKKDQSLTLLNQYSEFINKYMPFVDDDNFLILKNLELKPKSSDGNYLIQLNFVSNKNSIDKEYLTNWAGFFYSWPGVIQNIMDGTSGISYYVSFPDGNHETGIIKTRGQLVLENSQSTQ